MAQGDWTRASIQRDKVRQDRIWSSRAIERADDVAHVEMWDVVQGLAGLLGRDRAVALVVQDLETEAALHKGKSQEDT